MLLPLFIKNFKKCEFRLLFQIGKEKLEKITKEKCFDHVNTVCNAIEEISNGLEEENTTEEKVLLYKCYIVIKKCYTQ